MTAPTICAVLIARNEQRDIPKCIASLKGVADKLVVVDTGSTDDTLAAAGIAWREFGAFQDFDGHYWTGASEPNPDKPGEWRITNFSKARNHALELAEQTGCSHILWLDADDVITTPLAIRRAPYYPEGVIGVWIEIGGGVRQLHYRLWPAKYKVRFEGWVHEYARIEKHQCIILNDAMIQHDAAPHEGANETSNERNMRILEAEYAANPNARTAFYLADTHKCGGRHAEAVKWYMVRLGYGEGFRDEFLFSILYMGRSMYANGDDEQAEAWLRRGLELAPDWQEFRMALANVYYQRKEYARAIDEASKALDKPIPPTTIWREKSQYRDQPARLISWCHEHLGNLAQSYVWSQLATRLIGTYDADWSKREAVLEQRLNAPIPQAPAINHKLRERIALHRPGAIGDILMTLNLVPAFKEAHPDVDLHYYCSGHLAKPEQLGAIIAAAGCDLVGDCAHLNRKQYDRVIDLVGYPLAEGYPEKPMRMHLLDYFAYELGLRDRDLVAFDLLYDPKKETPSQFLPSLTLRRPRRPEISEFTDGDDYATIQMTAGWSKYKQWDHQRWIDVRDQLGFPTIPIAEVEGRTLSQSIAVFANARMHIGIDSFCNHLTNYTWEHQGGGRRVPGVILWGSTQASAAGYPDNINISKGLSCQPCFRENPAISRSPRGPCISVVATPPLYGTSPLLVAAESYDDPRPHACMDEITVEEVVEAVREMWSGPHDPLPDLPLLPDFRRRTRRQAVRRRDGRQSLALRCLRQYPCRSLRA